LPDTISSITHVRWVTWLSPLGWLKEKLGLDNRQRTGLHNLQEFQQDPKQFYGFAIGLEPVVDTLVLTKRAMVKKTQMVASLAILYGQLLRYAQARGIVLDTMGPRMATFYGEVKDSVQLAAGIPVNSRGKGTVSTDISFLEMPPKGKMLVGHYEGPYSGLSKLYSAMRRYAFDKKLMLIAGPYEKYWTQPRSAADSLHMKIEIHFPVI